MNTAPSLLAIALGTILCANAFAQAVPVHTPTTTGDNLATLARSLDTLVNENAATFRRSTMIPADKSALESVVEVSSQILAQPNIAPALAVFTLKRRGKALALLVRANPVSPHRAALAEFSAAAAGLDDPELAKIAAEVETILLQVRIQQITATGATTTETEILALTADVRTQLERAPGRETDFIVERLVETSQRLPAAVRPRLQAAMGDSFSEVYLRSKDPRDRTLGEQYAGMARRARLIGDEMMLNGFLVDGSPFDPKTLQGKVILVDFWATWCPECLKTLPTLIDIHRRYAPRGFAVLGISSDQSVSTLQQFLAQGALTDPATQQRLAIPWPVMAERLSLDAKQTPVSTYYGVNKLPTHFLIGRNGKVVATAVSMEALVPLLEKELNAAP